MYASGSPVIGEYFNFASIYKGSRKSFTDINHAETGGGVYLELNPKLTVLIRHEHE